MFGCGSADPWGRIPILRPIDNLRLTIGIELRLRCFSRCDTLLSESAPLRTTRAGSTAVILPAARFTKAGLQDGRGGLRPNGTQQNPGPELKSPPTAALRLAARGRSAFGPLADARGSVAPASYRTATVRKRLLPQAARWIRHASARSAFWSRYFLRIR